MTAGLGNRIIRSKVGLRYYPCLLSKGRPIPRLCSPISGVQWCPVSTTTSPSSFDKETDILVVGAGAAGLTAALRAQYHGLQPLVVEKDDKIGGSSAYSGGALWIPNNPISQAAGVRDSTENGLRYMNAVIGDVGPASSKERKVAFLENGPRMVAFLREEGFRWHFDGRGCPDYFPKAPGSMPNCGNRTIEPSIFDIRALGPWKDHLRERPGRSIPLLTSQANSIMRFGASWRDFATLMKIMLRARFLTLRGQIPKSMGQSLVAQLLFLNKQCDTQILRNAPLVELITGKGSDGSPTTVTGAWIQHEGRRQSVRARHGVLLTSGGFAHNKQMREKWGPSPASIEWTNTPPGDTGDAITAGMNAGAATALLDDAWWGPAIKDPVTGKYLFALSERARPFSIIVDSSGSRFMNEAEPYTEAGHHQYERHQKVPAVPAWLIFDQNFRQRYVLGSLPPRQPDPKTGLESGFIFKADSIDDLARQIDVNVRGLKGTLERFNHMAKSGVDEDFHRGDSTFDNYFGDPAIRPNPNLGPIERPPYYAVSVVPGDLGTKGGLLTDEFGRVLMKNDTAPIEQLYAAGNTTASVMGRTYPGAGATLGPALTFAFIAVDHMARGKTA